MKKVRVEEAIGMVLAHDLTKIVPGEFKGVAFKKGHIIQEEDVAVLKDMGKYHIPILNLTAHHIHEEEAAIRLGKAVAGTNIHLTPPSEGKVHLLASQKGVLKVNTSLLEEINEIPSIILSTRHNNSLIEENQLLAGTKIIPLVIEEEKIKRVEALCKDTSVVDVLPLNALKVGLVITGSEVYEGRIKDRFAPVLIEKINALGGYCFKTLFAPDNKSHIMKCIDELIQQKADLIMLSGGMSVDADDVTPHAIEQMATEVISYGSPVLPGAMFMLAYKNNLPIIGIPACGMFNKITVLDLLLPRLFAKEKLGKKDLVKLAHGGLCLKCSVCHYPICPLGK